MYRRVKKLQVLIINKDICKYLALKKGNDILIWSWNKFIGSYLYVSASASLSLTSMVALT